jgi:hypothetical protein
MVEKRSVTGFECQADFCIVITAIIVINQAIAVCTTHRRIMGVSHALNVSGVQ